MSEWFNWFYFGAITLIIEILITAYLTGVPNITTTDTIKVVYAFIGIFFVISFILKIDSRFSIAAALLALASCPFLLILKKDPIAEQMAIYAYFWLVAGVVLQVIEYLRLSPKEREKLEKEDDEIAMEGSKGIPISVCVPAPVTLESREQMKARIREELKREEEGRLQRIEERKRLKMESKRKLLEEKLRKEVGKELMEEERIRKEQERKEKMKQRIEERKFWELEQARMKEELRAKLIEERKKKEKQIDPQKDIISIDPRQINIEYEKKESTKDMALEPSAGRYALNDEEIRKKLVEARIRVEADLKRQRDKGEQKTSPTPVISKGKKKLKKGSGEDKDSKDTYGNLIFKSWPGDGKTEDIDMSEWSKK